MRNIRSAACVVALLCLSTASCALVGGGSEEPPWWDGEEEPSHDAKADGTTPLTIFFAQSDPSVRKVLGIERLGDLERAQTGLLDINGLTLGANTHIILKGVLYGFDGSQEEHLLIVKPESLSSSAPPEGSSLPSGTLRLDFAASASMREVEGVTAPFGTRTGIFRGEVLAADGVTLETQLTDDLTSYYLRPLRTGERPPNRIRDAVVTVRPNIGVERLKPEVDCFGDNIVDTTLAQTPLTVWVRTDGFPKSQPFDVTVRYRTPKSASSSTIGHIWDYVTRASDTEYDETVVTKTFRTIQPNGVQTHGMDDFTTVEPGYGRSFYEMEIEVSARSSSGSGPAAGPYVHRLRVVNPGAKVMVNQFELCPLGDGPCHDLRDGREPINVLALRTQIEQQAHELGLFDTMTRAIGRCAGGDRIAGNFADSCTVYQESTDTELSASLNAELNFELNVDGNAGGHGSWSASYGSLASAELEAAFKASFKLDVDLKARFSTSRVWRERHSLDVIYDPSNTQLQWWRVVTPRLRYVQFGEFDVCGGRVTSHDVFLSDLRESRLVLACESVPSYDTVCHAVEPEATSVAACNDLLIPADSPRGRECLGQ